MSNQSSALQSPPRSAEPRWLLFSNNNREWWLIHQRTDEGSALYRINATGEIFERVSPFHGAILVDGQGVIQDNDWVYYQASDADNDLPAFYSQRIDGSQHQELLRFNGQPIIMFNEDNELSINVLNQGGNGGQYTTYDILVEGDDVQLNESEGNFFPRTQLESGWVLVRAFDGSSFQSVRQRVDSDEREVVLAPNENQNIVGASQDGVYYVEHQDNFMVLKRVDANTLIHHQLTPSERFTDIRSFRPIYNSDDFIFVVTEDRKQSIYRINMDGSDLQLLMTFDHLNIQRYFQVYNEWLIVSDTDSESRRANTNIYRLNVKTGDAAQIASFTFGSSHIYPILSPDFDMFILSAPENGAISEQYYVDVSEGVSRKVDFGDEVFFADFPQQDFKSGLMALVGLVMVGLSGAIGYRWRNA